MVGHLGAGQWPVRRAVEGAARRDDSAAGLGCRKGAVPPIICMIALTVFAKRLGDEKMLAGR